MTVFCAHLLNRVGVNVGPDLLDVVKHVVEDLRAVVRVLDAVRVAAIELAVLDGHVAGSAAHLEPALKGAGCTKSLALRPFM